jgi:glutamate N-acetyltransferase/amino-acid N-acetyltransferase
MHGRDANWGRIAGAAGNALTPEAFLLEAAGLSPAEADARAGRPAAVDPARIRIAISGLLAYDGAAGGPTGIDKAAARDAMAGEDILVRIDVGLGAGTGEAFGCPLTEGYVKENAEYTS